MENGKFTKSNVVIEGREYTVYTSKNKITRDLNIKWELTQQETEEYFGIKNSIDLEDKSNGE